MDSSDKEDLGDVTGTVADMSESVEVKEDVVTFSTGAGHGVVTGAVEGFTESVDRGIMGGEAGAAVLARA